ncbi:MAG: FecR domain-containing protein [Saprospiraceae bacterium]|nr:FecR domain-containing protein [Saprospiraceae bacterium]
MNRSRLVLLTDKYSRGTLNKSEYEEFIALLGKSGNLPELDKVLDSHWDASSDKHLVKTDRKHKKPGIKAKRSIVFRWSIASSILLVAATCVWYFSQPTVLPSFTEYSTDYSGIKEVSLPDGSVVTLNANSNLIWSNDWEQNGQRVVQLHGEAFFDILHLNDDIAFIVSTDDVLVKVLGTSFNVDSRGIVTEVFLEEGKVELQLKNEQVETITMAPGERVKYNGQSKEVEKLANESMISSAAWKKGVLNFKNMLFSEVLIELNNIYGKNFECSDTSLLSKPMFVGVPYADWEAVQQALELSLNIKFTESEGKYLVETE